jgi:hypothetical protein
MQLANDVSRCTGHYRLVPFGTELHVTCVDCQRRLQIKTQEVTPWSSFAVEKDPASKD